MVCFTTLYQLFTDAMRVKLLGGESAQWTLMFTSLHYCVPAYIACWWHNLLVVVVSLAGRLSVCLSRAWS